MKSFWKVRIPGLFLCCWHFSFPQAALGTCMYSLSAEKQWGYSLWGEETGTDGQSQTVGQNAREQGQVSREWALERVKDQDVLCPHWTAFPVNKISGRLCFASPTCMAAIPATLPWTSLTVFHMLALVFEGGTSGGNRREMCARRPAWGHHNGPHQNPVQSPPVTVFPLWMTTLVSAKKQRSVSLTAQPSILRHCGKTSNCAFTFALTKSVRWPSFSLNWRLYFWIQPFVSKSRWTGLRQSVSWKGKHWTWLKY